MLKNEILFLFIFLILKNENKSSNLKKEVVKERKKDKKREKNLSLLKILNSTNSFSPGINFCASLEGRDFKTVIPRLPKLPSICKEDC